MDPIVQIVVQITVAAVTGGGAIAVLKWFAGRVLDLLERRIESTAAAVDRMEPQVDALHAVVCRRQRQGRA